MQPGGIEPELGVFRREAARTGALADSSLAEDDGLPAAGKLKPCTYKIVASCSAYLQIPSRPVLWPNADSYGDLNTCGFLDSTLVGSGKFE